MSTSLPAPHVLVLGPCPEEAQIARQGGLGKLESLIFCSEGCPVTGGFSAAEGIHLVERTGGPGRSLRAEAVIPQSARGSPRPCGLSEESLIWERRGRCPGELRTTDRTSVLQDDGPVRASCLLHRMKAGRKAISLGELVSLSLPAQWRGWYHSLCWELESDSTTSLFCSRKQAWYEVLVSGRDGQCSHQPPSALLRHRVNITSIRASGCPASRGHILPCPVQCWSALGPKLLRTSGVCSAPSYFVCCLPLLLGSWVTTLRGWITLSLAG